MGFEIKNGILAKYTGDDLNIVIPEGVTRIKRDAFSGWVKYESITLPITLKTIDFHAFGLCEFKKVYVPSIESWMSIKFDNASPVSYGTELYINGELLENLVIPADVAKVNDYCFMRCKSLKRVEILGPTQIGDEAFSGCSGLEEVVLSDDVPKIGYQAFFECTSLSRINIPSGIRTIESLTFRMCKFESLVIPEGVKRIEAGAFQCCYDLKTVQIPASVKEIGAQVFEKCSSLESVVTPKGLSAFGENMFEDCKALKEITIGPTAKKVSESMLPTSLEKIVIRCKLSAFTTKTFKELKSLESVYVSEDQVEAAKKLIKKAQVYTLDGESITKTKEPSKTVASAELEKTIVSYPSKVPDITMPVETLVLQDGVPVSFAMPLIKEANVQTGELRFNVMFKAQINYGQLWTRYYENKNRTQFYDPKIALEKAEYDPNNGHITMGGFLIKPLEYNIPKGIDPLTQEEAQERVKRFIEIANGCLLEENVKAIIAAAQKKKDGKLFKGRLLHLAFLDLVDETGEICELVAKNEGDLNMVIDFRNNTPVTEDLFQLSFVFKG